MAQPAPGILRVAAPDMEPMTVVLDKPVLRIGRLPAPDNDLHLAHRLVSRRHAQIFCDRLPHRIVDLGSKNGTLVNDTPLPANEVRELHDGDTITIGPFTLTYVAPLSPEKQPEIQDLLAGVRLEQAPGTPPPREPPYIAPPPGEKPAEPWVGMPTDRSRWLQYLPYIYAEDEFIGRYLLIFEDLFGPLDQIIAHFDLYLDPRTAPEGFLTVLASWLGLVLDDRWPAEKRRAIIRSAVELYDLRGTKRGLTRLLEATTGCQVEIVENADGPHSFRVRLTPTAGQEVDEQMVRHLIEINKPAHTVYTLQITTAR